MRPDTECEWGVDHALERLRETGYKVTQQRRAMVTIFFENPVHRTPQEAFDLLFDTIPSLSLATVYNNLEVFERIGLLRRVHAEGGMTYFDSNVEPHHHAVCTRCGQIFDVAVAEAYLQQILSEQVHGISAQPRIERFVVEEAILWLRGRCGECS